VEKEETPKIMMIRVQSLEEREDQRITEFRARGRQLDEEYNDIFRTHNEDQQRLNEVARECDQKPNREGLIEALIEQINFDSQIRKKYDEFLFFCLSNIFKLNYFEQLHRIYI
jgi:hypothetical protein